MPKELMGDAFDDGAFDDGFDDDDLDDGAGDIKPACLGGTCGDRPRRLKTLNDAPVRQGSHRRQDEKPAVEDALETPAEAENVEKAGDVGASPVVTAQKPSSKPRVQDKLAEKFKSNVFIGANSANPPDPNHCYWRPEKVLSHHKRGPPSYR